MHLSAVILDYGLHACQISICGTAESDDILHCAAFWHIV